MESKTIVLSDQDKSYRILLPDADTDYIQKKIRDSGIPYELDMLRDMAGRLEPGDLVLDIGANVGNHSLYLAAIAGCRVIAFEPNRHLADTLIRSAGLNGLGERLRVHAEGVGRVPGVADFETEIPDNLGMQRLVEGRGDIPVVTLDGQDLDGSVKLIKVDVEGMEISVLHGAEGLIARDRPVLYVECATESAFREIAGLLGKRGYLFWDSFNATPTHLFVPEESVSPDMRLQHFRMREMLHAYQNSTALETARQALHSSNLKYRTVSQQVASAREEHARMTARAEAAERELNALQHEAEALRSSLREARDRQPVMPAELRVEQDRLQAALNAARSERDVLRSYLGDAHLKYHEISQQLAVAQAEQMAKQAPAPDGSGHPAKAEAAAEIDRLKGEIRGLEARLHDRTGAPAAGAVVEAGCVAGWVRSLPLPPGRIARIWLDLARRLSGGSPDQALALLRSAHLLDPAPDIARRLGIALAEAGARDEALALLEPLAAGLNLSSREDRLLALLRAGHRGADLRARAARATRSRLRMAAIMDEFTATGYAPECDLQQLSLTGWQAELEDFRPELLLVESAWRGLNEEWGGRVGQFSPEMQGILDWCRAQGIPTAFWNKEDPVHFETFLNTAQKFDLVFTTDIDCIPRYKAGLGHDRVHLLPFACQPEIHNPVEIGPRKEAFCFAGAYYTRYPDRTRDLDDFLAHLTPYRPFEIFDRNFGKDHPDYMFPEAYRHHIVGTLPPTEIGRAYKGYAFGINLNSVKNSQSMYARRVYELLACNTRIVSNYSPGLRLMFGELVISTDSGAEVLRRIRTQDDTGRSGRLRLAGLRKALSEHTCGHRLAHILRKAGLDERPDAVALPPVTVLGRATTQAECDSLLAQFARQTLPGARMLLVAGDDLDLPDTAPAERIRRIDPAGAAGLRLGDLAAPDEWLAGFRPGDHYGANYLTDLILATRYSQAPVLGKAAHHRADAGGITLTEGASYGPVTALAARRALLRGDVMPEARLDHWLAALPDAVVEAGEMLALDPYNHCEDGARDPQRVAEVTAAVDDLADLRPGFSIAELNAIADSMAPAQETAIGTAFLSGADICAGMAQPASGVVSWQVQDGDWFVTSTLPDEEHTYIYENRSRPLADLRGPDGYRLHPLVGLGLSAMFVAVYQDARKQKISHQMLNANRNALLSPPEGTEFIRFGIRVRGPGDCRIRGFVLAEHHPAPRPIISRSRILLLTNHYPSDRDLYRNGFIHSRVRAYRELGGITPDIFRLRPEQATSWHEFQNIDCISGSAEQLDFMLAGGQYDHVLVHFLDEAMWQVLSRHIDRIRVTVWVHGAEVQPWWRRAFNYATDAEREKAREASDQRLAFWRGLFAPLPANLHFVFVSQYFADEVFEDLEVACPPDHYDIIHNPIDDQLFRYHEKPADQRAKILSIRSFASPKYANDLSVGAILALSRRDFFHRLEFRLVGDGPLFDEVTAPLAGFPNVTCQRGFLTQDEIAALQRDYGVFLNPTRWDSQGVSRDEAMSAGLVPVTNRISAIPEFLDETSGYLAEPEDAEGLARAIIDMWKNPEIFQRKSRAAAERVRRQRAREQVIRAELDIIQSVARPSGTQD